LISRWQENGHSTPRDESALFYCTANVSRSPSHTLPLYQPKDITSREKETLFKQVITITKETEMKNNSTKTLVYSQYPEEVKHRVESVFSMVLELYPYPQSIDEQIDWIHNMAGSLKTIEADSVMLAALVKK
jgi:hypothetical protein